MLVKALWKEKIENGVEGTGESERGFGKVR